MKRVLISILMLFMVVTMTTTVDAATANINVGASAESVIKGKTFTVTIAGTADNNITGMQANFKYDSTKISMESKSAGAGFSDVSGSAEIAIAATSSESLSKSGTLYTITFKVLDTAEVGETTISVSDATLALVNANSEQENVSAGNGSATIKIKEDDTTAGNQGGTTETPKEENTATEDKGNIVGNSSSNNNSSSNKSTNTNKSSNTKKNTTTKLPQTGVESFSVIAIVALGAIAIASYVSYRKYKNI